MTTGAYTLTWDSVASTTLTGLVVQRLRRGMVGAIRDTRLAIPGVDGDILFAERRGNRNIVAQCSVIGGLGGQRHGRVVAVADWLDRDGYRPLVLSDQPDRYWLAALSADPDPDEWRQRATFDLQWTAKPYAYALSQSSVVRTGLASNSAQTFVVADQVDAYPVIELTARGGTATAIDITVNGSVLTFAGPLLQDQTITFSSLSYTAAIGTNTDVMLTGALLGAAFPAAISGTWPLLVEGNNAATVAWTGAATTVDLSIYWRRRYR